MRWCACVGISFEGTSKRGIFALKDRSPALGSCGLCKTGC